MSLTSDKSIMAAAVAQTAEDCALHHNRHRNQPVAMETKADRDAGYDENPEEEPLLLNLGRVPGAVHEKTQADKVTVVETIGDNLDSIVLENKEKSVNEVGCDLKDGQRTTQKGVTKRILDDAYENIWIKGEMLTQFRQDKLVGARDAHDSGVDEEAAVPLIDSRERERRSEISLQRQKQTVRISALSKKQASMMNESEYSTYWRGEVTVIKPEELKKNKLQLGLQTLSMVEPLIQSMNSLDQTISSSAITSAIIKGDNPLLLQCLKQGEKFTLTCTKTGRSYLHLVTMFAAPEHELKFVPMVFQLSNYGIDLDVRDNSGETAIRYAINRKLSQLLAALLKCGADFTDADQYCLEQVKGVSKSEMMELVRRLTPNYWAAVHESTPFKVHRLVKSWSRVNLSRNNLTLIEYTKQNVKDESIVKLLLQHEASIELAHAVMAGDPDRTKLLLCHNDIDLDTRDASVKNNYFEPFAPLSLVGAAIKYDHADVLKVLRNAKLNVKSYAQRGEPQRENTPAGGDNSAFIKRGHSYDGAGVSVFHYKADIGGSCEFQPPELLTSTVCGIL